MLYNPLNSDFTTTFDVNGDSKPESFTVPALQIATFEEATANHLKEHLAKHVVFSRGIKTNFEDEYNKALKEVEVGNE